LEWTLAFTWLTSWKMLYGFTNSRSLLFKGLTLLHALGFKVLLVCLVQVISNVSPLLHTILGKLLPG
jgi:hypothetical protein